MSVSRTTNGPANAFKPCERLRYRIYRLAQTLAAIAMACCSITSAAQHVRFVDPRLGAGGGGNIFPGATLPFGMLKAGPDMNANNSNAGWEANGVINGFSQTHVSGTGGGSKYGNILLQPTVGDILPADHASSGTHESAEPGFYGVVLERYGVHVEIASARRSALYRFTYPSTEDANLLIDAAHCLSSSAAYGENQQVTAARAKVLSANEIEGSTTVTGGWNKQPNTYTVYFYLTANVSAQSSGTWEGAALHRGAGEVRTGDGVPGGAWLIFHPPADGVVTVKIGISYISTEQARKNATKEIPGFDFEKVRNAASAEWEKALSQIDIEGASLDDKMQFYSALYHSMLMPADRTGENPLFDSKEPSYDDFYAIWDTFRTSSPLLTLIDQKRESDIVRSLIDLYRHEHWLPDARSGNYNGRVQGGSNADMVIVDGYLKHIPGVDWKTAYRAIVRDAEVTSPSPDKEGRSDLEEWKHAGYLSMEGTDRPASKQMEYAANDYAIALMAKGMENSSDYRTYSKRARNWKSLWYGEAEDHGYRGFIWPRHRDGRWKQPFDVLLGGTWGSDSFYEGNAWTYSLDVPHDVAGLIEVSGGDNRFVERMNAFFELPGRYDVSNEPGFLAPYLYLWAGRPDCTQERIREILAANYHSGTQGLPGNDDSGAMSSWYIFGKVGIYPLAGQDLYVIGSPAFPTVTIHLPDTRTLTIETESNSASSPYIASVLWNGKPWTRSWMTHDELMRGGTLHFFMSDLPQKWGAAPAPPSQSSTH